MRALWLAPALALTVSACGSTDPLAERRADVEAVTLAANDGSAAGLRSAIEDLRSTLRAQVASDELDRAEAERLNTIAVRLLESADLLEPAPSPVPTVEEEPEPEPTQEEPEPSPPQEEPEPEPTEEPEPEPTQEEPEPEPEQTLQIEPFPAESPPSAQSQGGTGTTAEPSPAA